MPEVHETYETTQPWVTYTFGLTHDRWWPVWTSTRVLGRARIRLTCCVCGEREVVSLQMPRFGKVPEPDSGRHPERERFLGEHAHPDRGHPMSWALPMRNMAVFGPGGLDLDLLGARLEADLNESACLPSEDCDCPCHRPGGMTVSHMVACCSGVVTPPAGGEG